MVLVRRRRGGGGGRPAAVIIIKDEPIASGVVQRRIVHARVHDRTHDLRRSLLGVGVIPG